jgi:RNA polymerase sigma-70 factor, ECF subfamily
MRETKAGGATEPQASSGTIPHPSQPAAQGSASPDYSDEAELVSRLRAGNQDAYRQAVARYSPRMLATARAIVGQAHADDIVQDAWVTVFRQIDRFEQRSALATWLQRIVTNGAISHLRRHKKETTLDTVGDEAPEADWFDHRGNWANPPAAWDIASPDDLLNASDLQECIDKHIESMTDTQRQVLVMRDMQTLSFDDICNDLDLTASNVRVLLHRARTRLMKMVNHFQETGTC